jgi:hypothetical protein
MLENDVKVWYELGINCQKQHLMNRRSSVLFFFYISSSHPTLEFSNTPSESCPSNSSSHSSAVSLVILII